MHQLVNKDFDNIKMHGTTVKIEKDCVRNLGSVSTVEEKKQNGISDEESEQTEKLLISSIPL